MASNSFGLIYRFTSFGESHGVGIGVVLDGVPANFPLDLAHLRQMLQRRRPGFHQLHSARLEADDFEIISGLFNGLTTGAPICFLVRNIGQKKNDYEAIKDIFRPGHADYTYYHKYKNYDPYGGGRASARETIARVIAGAVAMQFLKTIDITLKSRIIQIGNNINTSTNLHWEADTATDISTDMANEINRIKSLNDSIGGKIEIRADNLPPIVGEPIYEKLDARLAFGLMSINGVKGVEIGSAEEAAQSVGSVYNDAIYEDGFHTNHCGGVLGGISSSQPLICRISIKPTPSIAQVQKTIDKKGKQQDILIQGRHDPCILLRALVVAESMVACVIFDLLLLHQAQQWNKQG